MSTRGHTNVERTVACRPANVTPVEIDAAELETTAPDYLRDVKSQLASDGYQPATLTVDACFAENCSLATQQEADRLRGYVRAAVFLGAGRVELTVDEVADPEKVVPALDALVERADREGVSLAVVGDATVSLDLRE